MKNMFEFQVGFHLPFLFGWCWGATQHRLDPLTFPFMAILWLAGFPEIIHVSRSPINIQNISTINSSKSFAIMTVLYRWFGFKQYFDITQNRDRFASIISL